MEINQNSIMTRAQINRIIECLLHLSNIKITLSCLSEKNYELAKINKVTLFKTNKRQNIINFIDMLEESTTLIKTSFLYGRYKIWCERHNYLYYTQPSFISFLRESHKKQYEKSKNGRSKGWLINININD